jgi:hypothetical protein
VIYLITLALSMAAAFALPVPYGTKTAGRLPQLSQIELFDYDRQDTYSHD